MHVRGQAAESRLNVEIRLGPLRMQIEYGRWAFRGPWEFPIAPPFQACAELPVATYERYRSSHSTFRVDEQRCCRAVERPAHCRGSYMEFAIDLERESGERAP